MVNDSQDIFARAIEPNMPVEDYRFVSKIIVTSVLDQYPIGDISIGDILEVEGEVPLDVFVISLKTDPTAQDPPYIFTCHNVPADPVQPVVVNIHLALPQVVNVIGQKIGWPFPKLLSLNTTQATKD
ncbi:MAG: hypothetical protein KAW09_08870 [Thermoplasmata archaeon]|nr:hypothetical protein [Thermoplasmata archaeon]